MIDPLDLRLLFLPRNLLEISKRPNLRIEKRVPQQQLFILNRPRLALQLRPVRSLGPNPRTDERLLKC